MNINQLEKKLDEHFTRISETIIEYTNSFESRLDELVQANKQLQTKLNKSEEKRKEAEVKAKESEQWERKYYRLKEAGDASSKKKVKTVTRYTAYVQHAGRQMEVGTFDTPEEAKAAEKRAVKELHREEGNA